MALSIYIKIGVAFLSLLAFGVGKYYYHLPDDNPIEEMAEYAINDSCGINIDLSPNSPDPDIDIKADQSKL